ncbi:MAG TPA: hypothetical protein VN541_11530 [Tepidisphaeraceae bacterium]|nr:hypothetical protein [Tepidisphaeraceae bacterium]
MRLQLLRPWHWILIGLAMGLIVGVAAVLSGRNEQIGGAGFISQRQFEQALLMPPVRGRPYVQSVVIHPADEVDLLTMDVLAGPVGDYQTVRFAAPRPYIPKDGTSKGATYVVAEYLKDMSRANPAVVPGYAWWDELWAVIVIRMVAGMLIVGGVWPVVLRLVYGPPPERVRFDVGGPGVAARAAAKPQATEEDRRHLEELEAEMMAGMAATEPTPDVREVQRSPDPEVRVLAGETVEARPEAPPQEKDYRGEYYPVEKKGGGR